jgi:putative aminopeptidase FrvX
MRPESESFFIDLLEAAGPSGDERAPARVWRDYTTNFATVSSDAMGSSFAAVGDGKPTVAVFGHADEIGLVIVHVDDDGYLWFAAVGGWIASVLVGQRIRVLTRNGPVVGVIGQKPPHLTEPDERQKMAKLHALWIDIGAPDGDAARAVVRVGDLAVVEQPVLRLQGARLASRAVDNRSGTFVAAEAARLYAESPGPGRLVGVACVQEETTFAGAYTSAFGLAPDAAVVVDVTHCSDYSGVEKTRIGDVRLGRGPVVNRGAGVHSALTDLAIDTAEAEQIPVQLEAASGKTYTDADAVSLTRAGVPTCVISVPNRYMHSPNEIVDLGDLEATAALVAAICRRLASVPELS